MAEQYWRIGQLARAVGISVRTLHYYAAIGLLAASQRTPAEHRLYAAADVRRLYPIRALSQLGFSLAQIRTALDEEDVCLEAVDCRHLQAVMDRMTMLERYLTPEQLATLKEHRRQQGEETMANAWRQRDELTAALESARQAGENPRSPRVQDLCRRYVERHQRFIGDDAGILRAPQTMIEAEGVAVASGGPMTAELRAYLDAA